MRLPRRWLRLAQSIAFGVGIPSLVFFTFTWPLLCFFREGIPASAHSVESPLWRRMIPGDHLQFYYHVWLGADMLRGNTPPFLNLYEFNTGCDEERREIGSYFFPAPLLYAVGEWIGGRAFGWNFMLLVHIIAAYGFMVLLLRRFTSIPAAACVFSLPSLAVPFWWISLCGGSPTAISMAYVPLVWLGVDRAVRDERWWGGLLAGLGILLTYWTEVQVFFFLILSLPFACVFSLLARPSFEWKKRGAWLAVGRALWPALLALGVVLVLSSMVHARLKQDSLVAASGRSLREVALFSPTWRGLLGVYCPGYDGHLDGHIFLGWAATLGLVTGWGFALARMRHEGRRRAMLLSFLLSALAFCIVLALGPHGPFHGLAMRCARRWIPGYSLLRQSAKIFCLVPPLVSLTALLAAVPPGPLTRTNRWRIVSGAILVALMLGECRLQLRTQVALLDTHQEAYAAISADAAARGCVPRAIGLVLWPGDSHWSSLNQYYATLHRVRMVNGYRPFVPRRYVQDIFLRFQSLNLGLLTDAQADELLRRNIAYLVLHEDAFPEKVSPYPVGLTLVRLCRHPRLSLLRQAGSVWAFRLLDSPREKTDEPWPWTIWFPARQWELEDGRMPGATPVLADPNASRRGFVRLRPGEGAAVTHRSTEIVDVPRQRWMVRLRGHGTALGEEEIEGVLRRRTEWSLDSDTWTWVEWAIPAGAAAPSARLAIRAGKGTVDADMAMLVAGEWKNLSPGESVELPGASFFHAGHTDRERKAVVLEPDRDPADIIFYGLNLPVQPGPYRLTVEYETDVPAGVLLGECVIWCGQTERARFRLVAGETCGQDLDVPENLPLRVGLRYTRKGKLSVERIVLLRR